SLRRRLRWIAVIQGTCLLLTVLLGGVALAGLLDWQMQLPSLALATLLVAILTVAGCVAYSHLIAPLATRTDDFSLALKVENHYPILNDSLASTVQFLREQENSNETSSPAMRREAVKRALKLSEDCDFSKVVSARGARWAGVSFLVVGSIALTLALVFP